MVSAPCYPDKAPEVDRLLDTLSDNLQRELIHYFENVATEDTASLEDVVAHVDGRVPATDPEELAKLLHHVHLPKLAERGWLEYDVRSETIRYRGHDDAEALLTEVLEVFRD